MSKDLQLVRVSRDAYQKLKEIALEDGVPVYRVMDIALRQWLRNRDQSVGGGGGD